MEQLKERVLENLNKEICTCECHKKGSNILHMTSCCDFTYEKYINEDGTIDMDIYSQMVYENPFFKEEGEEAITTIQDFMNSVMGSGKTYKSYMDMVKEKEEHIKYLNDNCNTRQVRRKREREAKKLAKK